ncbi:MAG: flagellar protein FlaG [Candidatus Binatia bacterium]|nr:flagellar protein FlaG [Candidatus Binatia bacterium]
MKVNATLPEISALLNRAGPLEPRSSWTEGNRGKGNTVDPPRQPISLAVPDENTRPPWHAETVKPVVNGMQVGLEFVQDQATGRSVIRVYDRESGELIRQIPPEEVLAFLRRLAEGKGALVSKCL